LDEVGDIPLALQPKLLRALQKQEFERLGSTRTHHVNVRLVAATNRNLADMVNRSEFRSDLYDGLNVFPITLPPLRARREDIPAWWRILSSFIAAGWAIKSNAFLRKRCLHSARISGRETFASSKISSNGA
jgi:transcriptional regulator with GAF, ATPase, and Fis domain